MSSRFYRLAWLVLRPIFALLYPCKVHGAENLSPDAPFILCSNHLSARDPVFIAVRLPRRRGVAYLGKKELFELPLLGKLFRSLGGIPVDRGHADISAVRSAIAALKENKILMIFPQGTRSRDNTPTPMLSGASMIALRGGVAVYPVYIDGPYRLFRRTDLYFGEAIDMSAYGRRCDAETLDRLTRQIEGAVWGLKGNSQPSKLVDC